MLVWDVTCPDMFAPSYNMRPSSFAVEVGAVVDQAISAATHHFIPRLLGSSSEVLIIIFLI